MKMKLSWENICTGFEFFSFIGKDNHYHRLKKKGRKSNECENIRNKRKNPMNERVREKDRRN